MSGPAKLTAAQRELLEEAVRREGASVWKTYAPAQKLQALGFIKLREGKYGGCTALPTEAGRALLAPARRASSPDQGEG